MKKLGSLILPESLQWADRYDWAPVVMETERSLTGTPVIWSQALSGGRPVTLVAEKSVTWLEQSMVESIQAMASQAGAVFTLTWNNDTFSVMFRHHEPPVISFQPVRINSGRFTGSIKLMTL
ncbi:MAG: hypothetical protein HQL73_06515 [Magnetococcales bacterium]|nr:hypothetical protein [Magnetococcales bacterium]